MSAPTHAAVFQALASAVQAADLGDIDAGDFIAGALDALSVHLGLRIAKAAPGDRAGMAHAVAEYLSDTAAAAHAAECWEGDIGINLMRAPTPRVDPALDVATVVDAALHTVSGAAGPALCMGFMRFLIAYVGEVMRASPVAAHAAIAGRAARCFDALNDADGWQALTHSRASFFAARVAVSQHAAGLAVGEC